MKGRSLFVFCGRGDLWFGGVRGDRWFGGEGAIVGLGAMRGDRWFVGEGAITLRV